MDSIRRKYIPGNVQLCRNSTAKFNCNQIFGNFHQARIQPFKSVPSGDYFQPFHIKKKNLIIPIVRRVLQLFQSVTIENVYIPITCGELGGMPYHHSGLS